MNQKSHLAIFAYKPHINREIEAIFSSFNRHLRDEGYPYNMMTSDIFASSREVLSAKRKLLKGEGLGNRPNAAENISEEMSEIFWEKKLLGDDNPRSLQNTIFFFFTSTFGFRGCHESRQLTWGDITLNRDEKNMEYLQFSERLTKTRTGALGSKPRPFHPKIFANNTDRCPVKFYKFYKTKRPESMCQTNSPFYLTVKPRVSIRDNIWYAASPMGKNSLGKIMPEMAKAAGIEGKITNHSLRKRTCQTLLDEGINATVVCQLTGHKDVNSLNNYSVANRDMQKKMSDILTTGKDQEMSVVPAKKSKSNEKFPNLVETTSGMFSGATISGNITVNVHYNVMDSSSVTHSQQVNMSPNIPKAIE